MIVYRWETVTKAATIAPPPPLTADEEREERERKRERLRRIKYGVFIGALLCVFPLLSYLPPSSSSSSSRYERPRELKIWDQCKAEFGRFGESAVVDCAIANEDRYKREIVRDALDRAYRNSR